MFYLPSDCALTDSEGNSLEQWCYSNMSSSVSSHYIEEIKKEKIFVYQVTHVCKDVDLQITHGLSAARDFIPAVKILTHIKKNETNPTIRSRDMF